jgi:hypothetical protein
MSSDAPSWLKEEDIHVATNVSRSPLAQKAAKSPTVQNAAINAVKT